jgi:YegS/Rv2252/BmrU family lipid kinase
MSNGTSGAAPRNALIVLNPTAGNGKARKIYPKIEAYLKSRNIAYHIALTTCPGDAINIVRDYSLEPGTAVIAAGGDGTCNEVVNGLLTRGHTEPPVFGVLPIGRGNDFASSVPVPGNYIKALDIIIRGNTRPMDAGFVKGGFFPEGRYFVNGLGIGFDTQVGLEAAKMKKVHSSLAYVLGAVLTVARFKPSPVLKVSWAGEEHILPALQLSLMNGRRMGGTFFMGPKAQLDDGMLDICVVEHRTRRQVVNIIFHYTRGTQEDCPGVIMGRGMEFNLRALEGGMIAHSDGETVCLDGKALTVSCRAKALALIVP